MALNGQSTRWYRFPDRCDTRSDAELVAAIRRGDESAFNLVYERYFQRVHNFAYARVRNRADAEEVVQETFLSAFQAIDSFEGRSSLTTWLYRIAHNVAMMRLRRPSRNR